jgi:mono/diheme cytochrome c family protein
MLKGIIIGIVLTVAVGLIGGYAIVRLGVIPANANAVPGPIEKWVARTSLHATLNREAPKEPNPVPLNDTNLIAGIKLYAQDCAICHGTAEGAKSATPIAKGLNPKPPQLADDGVEDDPEGVSFWKIKNGIRWTGMPSWESALSDQQIWTIALFLKHMDQLSPAAKDAWRNAKSDCTTDLQQAASQQ